MIKRRSRGFICVNAHPEGCRRNVERWVEGVRGNVPNGNTGPKNVLVIGASTGYGLASRIAAAWGCGAKTLGVFFERPPEGDKTATAGYYNTAAFHSLARQDGLFAASINGDAFSDEIKRATAGVIRAQMNPVDLVILFSGLAQTHPIHGRAACTKIPSLEAGPGSRTATARSSWIRKKWSTSRCSPRTKMRLPTPSR